MSGCLLPHSPLAQKQQNCPVHAHAKLARMDCGMSPAADVALIGALEQNVGGVEVMAVWG